MNSAYFFFCVALGVSVFGGVASIRRNTSSGLKGGGAGDFELSEFMGALQ